MRVKANDVTSSRVMSVLTAVVMPLLLVGWWVSAPVATHAQPTLELELIGEMTGYTASRTALRPDCLFSDEYQLYLCEPPTPLERPQSNSAARAQAMALLNSTGALFIINSTAKQLMVFDPTTGDLVDPVFIQLDDDATGTGIHAIMSADKNVLVSDQTRDVVHEYDLAGNYLGIFAPAGGADTSIMDNIRGIALRPNGHLLVSVGAGPNGHAIAEFDTNGNYVGNFVANGSGGLISPFDVYERPSTDWLVSSIDTDQLLRYDWANGTPLGLFAPVNNFPQQIVAIGNGNILVGNFGGTQGVHEFTAGGTFVGVYNPASVTGYRGVYELPNGNLLTSTSGGVYEIDRSNNLISTKHTGQSRFIEFVTLEAIQLNKTVGLDASVCADTTELTVPLNTAVTYCFGITNATDITLTRHDLGDTHLGTVLADFSFNLAPGASVFVTQTAVLTQTTVNTATWTAYNPGPIDAFSATATAMVTVVSPSITLTKTVGTDASICATTDEIAVAVGMAVTYCYEVTNTSLTTFALHNLHDTALGDILSGLSFSLAPGASVFVTQTAVITQTTVNTATWTAYNAGPTDVAEASATATVTAVPLSIALSKTVGTDASACATTAEITVVAGTAVTYCYEVTNTGQTPLSTHDLADSELGDILTGLSFNLGPGATVFVTQTAVITQTTINSATWTAYNPGPINVAQASATATVVVVSPAITLTATVGLDPETCAASKAISVTVGTAVAYCYTVTNTGDITLTQHNISDSILGTVDNFAFDLGPGVSVSLVYTQTIFTNTLSVVDWLAESGLFQATATDGVQVTIMDEPEVSFGIYLPMIIKP